jgi:hypothetical protein
VHEACDERDPSSRAHGSFETAGARDLRALRPQSGVRGASRCTSKRAATVEVSMLKRMGLAIVVTLLMIPALGQAQNSPADDEHHGPRPEAIAACKDKTEGDACEFDAPRGHIAGACRKVRTGDLACVHPHHHHDGSS